MKKKRSALCLLLAVCLALSVAAPAAAENVERDYTREESLAFSLKALGLFQGYSGTNLGLDETPTRIQALVMMLRLMGLEQTALQEGGAVPFFDVAQGSWSAPYVGYAYQHGLVKGQSDTVFGVDDPADVRTFLTFVLRALGYTEGEDGDFRWSSPVFLAQQAGIVPDTVRFTDFRRADVVAVSYAALSAKLKYSGQTLASSLVERGVLSQSALDMYYDAGAVKDGKLNAACAENVAEYYRSIRITEGIDISGLPVSYYNAVALVGDAGYELFGFAAQDASDVAHQIANGAAAVEGRARVFGIIVPNRLGAVLSYEDANSICSSKKDETAAIAYAYGEMGSKVITVDAMTNLRLHNDEYIFFRTDHHWTALGSYYAYEAWAKAAGFTPVSLDDFEQREYPGHLGYFYSVCNYPGTMSSNPDTVTAYIPHSNYTCDPADAMSFSSAGYTTFLGGDRAITVIVNNDVQDDSACVLVKDSYGNPFAVWLTQHYHTVYVIDYRYYRDKWDHLTFSQFVDQKGVQDFIVLLPMTLSQSSYTTACMAQYCR